MGMRAGEVQVWPSDEVLITMSFSAQLARKRQSCQADKDFSGTVNFGGGQGGLRRPPPSP